MKHHGIAVFSVAFCGAVVSLFAFVSASQMDVFIAPYVPTTTAVISTGKRITGDRGIETPEVQHQAAAHLLFAGDIMLDREVANRMRRANDLAYPFENLPDGWIASFDYSIANLEGPVTDKRLPPVKSIDFQFSPDVIPMLKAQGFDAFSQANNHALDQGNTGYTESVNSLRAAGFLTFGHQVWDDENALATTTVNGFRVAFLGFNTTDNVLDKDAAAHTIQTAKSGSDKLIVFMHWGLEYHDHPQQKEVDLAHWFIDQGVDVVIGGHPHWEQGISIYKGKPIAWSLGNFVFDQDWSVRTREGLALGLTFTSDTTELDLYPVYIDKSRPELLDGIKRHDRLDRIASVSDEELRDQIRAGMIEF